MWITFVIAVAAIAFSFGLLVGALVSTVSKCEEVQTDSFERTVCPDPRNCDCGQLQIDKSCKYCCNCDDCVAFRKKDMVNYNSGY
jgi:hypothetical protein